MHSSQEEPQAQRRAAKFYCDAATFTALVGSGPDDQTSVATRFETLASQQRLSQRCCGAFGIDVDYAQLIKIYGPTVDAAGPERKYSPGECCGIRKHRVLGKPIKALVSTSYVEKHNQTMRQHMRRFARLTAGHSKKIDNHVAMVALYTTWYNFARINSAVRMSPARACGLEQRLWDVGDIVKLIEEWEAAQ